ncbi:MAG: hypothetical protein ABI024_17640 [Vicinamibacterales bacterium]
MDTRFESRLVADKILRQDETLLEDQRNKERFLRAVDDAARSGDLTLTFVVNNLHDLLVGGRDREPLRARVAGQLDSAPITSQSAASVFDALADDPACAP